MKSMIGIILILIMMTLAKPIKAADFQVIGNHGGGASVVMVGEIKRGDAYILANILAKAKVNRIRVDSIYLNSPGGNLYEGYQLLLVVYKAGLTTIVPDNVECASACFLVFAAGNKRIGGRRAKIGVHSVSAGGHEDQISKASTVDMARIYKELDVPPKIIGMAVTVAPTHIYWLTDRDLREMGVSAGGSRSGRGKYVSQQAKSAPAVEQMYVYPDATQTKRNRVLARSLNAKSIALIRRYTGYSVMSAISLLEKARKADPYDAEVLGNLGYAYYLTRQLSKARDILMLSLNLRPRRGSSWINLGQTLAELHNESWAAECLGNYLKYSKNKQDAVEQLTQFSNNISLQVSPVLQEASRRALLKWDSEVVDYKSQP